jgi:arsenite methyltransferase
MRLDTNVDRKRMRAYEDALPRQALGDILRPGGLALTDEALAASALPPNARILDVGCGAGTTVSHLRRRHGLRAIGIDASSRLLASGSRDPASPLALARGEHLPVRDGVLDAVIAECSFSVLSDPNAALREFRRVLNPDGCLILTDIYLRSVDGHPLPLDYPPPSCLSETPTREQVASKLANYGFEVAVWRDRSDSLRYLAAQLIMSGVSLAQLWGGACADLSGATARRALGYYWLIAGKQELGAGAYADAVAGPAELRSRRLGPI